jgi:hypothetical protein
MVTGIMLRRRLVFGPGLLLTVLLVSVWATGPAHVTVEVTGTPGSNGIVKVALWNAGHVPERTALSQRFGGDH